ncbi:hypothetical protein OSTOST_11154, partial [Ostertagia ostertagi]
MGRIGVARNGDGDLVLAAAQDVSCADRGRRERRMPGRRHRDRVAGVPGRTRQGEVHVLVGVPAIVAHTRIDAPRRIDVGEVARGHALDIADGPAVHGALHREVQDAFAALGDAGHAFDQAVRHMPVPGVDVVFLQVGEAQQHPVGAHAPDDAVGIAGIGPFLDRLALEQVAGEDRDVAALEAVRREFIGDVADLLARRRDIDRAALGGDRRDLRDALVALRLHGAIGRGHHVGLRTGPGLPYRTRGPDQQDVEAQQEADLVHLAAGDGAGDRVAVFRRRRGVHVVEGRRGRRIERLRLLVGPAVPLPALVIGRAARILVGGVERVLGLRRSVGRVGLDRRVGRGERVDPRRRAARGPGAITRRVDAQRKGRAAERRDSELAPVDLRHSTDAGQEHRVARRIPMRAGHGHHGRIALGQAGDREAAFEDVAALLDHAHLLVAELQHVGLRRVEGEGDQARPGHCVDALTDERRARPRAGAAERMDEPVQAGPQAHLPTRRAVIEAAHGLRFGHRQSALRALLVRAIRHGLLEAGGGDLLKLHGHVALLGDRIGDGRRKTVRERQHERRAEPVGIGHALQKHRLGDRLVAVQELVGTVRGDLERDDGIGPGPAPATEVEPPDLQAVRRVGVAVGPARRRRARHRQGPRHPVEVPVDHALQIVAHRLVPDADLTCLGAVLGCARRSMSRRCRPASAATAAPAAPCRCPPSSDRPARPCRSWCDRCRSAVSDRSSSGPPEKAFVRQAGPGRGQHAPGRRDHAGPGMDAVRGIFLQRVGIGAVCKLRAPQHLHQRLRARRIDVAQGGDGAEAALHPRRDDGVDRIAVGRNERREAGTAARG